VSRLSLPVDELEVDCSEDCDWRSIGQELAHRASSHVTVYARNFDETIVRELCWPIAEANPTILWDLITEDLPPSPAELRALREAWPHEIGYLDRVAVFARPEPSPAWTKVSPRMALVVDAGAPVEPLAYEGIALVLWRLPDMPSPQDLAMVMSRGGDGVVVAENSADATVTAWAEAQGLLLWHLPAVPIS
jgi:hypothetical protein